jgi:hypothetical protein
LPATSPVAIRKGCFLSVTSCLYFIFHANDLKVIGGFGQLGNYHLLFVNLIFWFGMVLAQCWITYIKTT